jgi:hypothetical protein
MSLQHFSWTLTCSFIFLILYTVGRTSLGGISPSQCLYLHTEQHKYGIKHTIHTSMPWVGFEPTIPAFERAKAAYALDRAATVITSYSFRCILFVQVYFTVLQEGRIDWFSEYRRVWRWYTSRRLLIEFHWTRHLSKHFHVERTFYWSVGFFPLYILVCQPSL